MTSSTSILVYKGKILLILRDNNPNIPEPDTWQLPGGGVKAGEDHYLAIQRELREEINIVPSQLRCLGLASDDICVFFAFLNTEEVQNIKLGDEGQKLKFFSLEDALKQRLTKKLRRYFTEFKHGVTDIVHNGFINDISKIGLAPLKLEK